MFGIGIGVLSIVLNLPKSSEVGGDHPSEEELKKIVQEDGDLYRSESIYKNTILLRSKRNFKSFDFRKKKFCFN